MQSENSNSTAEGDHTAYIEKIYVEVIPRLRRFAAKRWTPDEADDIANEAFCNFMAHMEKHDWKPSIRNPFSFLAKIVVRLISDKLRREPPKNVVSLNDENHPVEPSDNGVAVRLMHYGLDKKDGFRKIQENTEKFSSYEEELLRLLNVDKRKPAEIAVLLGQSYEKTSIDCNRVKARYRARLKKNVRGE